MRSATLAVGAAILLCGFAPERDYFPQWKSVAPSERETVKLGKGATAVLGRFVPQTVLSLEADISMKGRNVLGPTSKLIRLDDGVFTACEIFRPKGHESFYCLVDADRDGKFEGFYHLFSNSYALLSGWTNRVPEALHPVSYRPAEGDPRRDFVELRLSCVGGSEKGYFFEGQMASAERPDFWIGVRRFKIDRDMVGKTVTIVDVPMRVVAFDAGGPTVEIIRPPVGTVRTFVTPKGIG